MAGKAVRMRTIRQYPFNIDDVVIMRFPLGGRVVHVAMEGDSPTMWILIDTDSTTIVMREFYIVKTDSPIPNYVRTHIGTFQEETADNLFVWHVFD